MAGIEARHLELRLVLDIDAAGFHEIERLANAVGNRLVLFGPGAAAHEIQRPLVHLPQIGIAAGGEGAQQVQRGGRLAVGAHHAHGVVAAAFGREIDAVDVVAVIAGQFHPADRLGRGAARLGKLARHARHLHYRHLAGISEHGSHLQDHAQRVADIVRREFGEAFGAVAALQQEGIARRHIAQLGLQRARFARKDQRGKPGQHALGLGQSGGVFIVRQVLCNELLLLPAIGCPVLCHGLHIIQKCLVVFRISEPDAAN